MKQAEPISIMDVNIALRKRLFSILCVRSSQDFIEYLRVYEDLPMPRKESFEVSCELVSGMRRDSARLAILGLHRQDVLRWLYRCHREIPLIQKLLFNNTTECFGIGLTDYPLGLGVCRIKIYNEYGLSKSQVDERSHIQSLFAILNIPDNDYKQDLERFGKVHMSGIDWDCNGQATIKVYFGFFQSGQSVNSLKQSLSDDDSFYYNTLRDNGLLPETFLFCIRYSRGGRSVRTDMRVQTRKIVPYLRIFDHQGEIERFLADFSSVFLRLSLEFVSVNLLPVKKVQFHFCLGKILGNVK